MNSNTKNSSLFSRTTSFSLMMLGWVCSFLSELTSARLTHSSQEKNFFFIFFTATVSPVLWLRALKTVP